MEVQQALAQIAGGREQSQARPSARSYDSSHPRYKELRYKLGVIYQRLVFQSERTPVRTPEVASALDAATIYLCRILDNPFCIHNWLHIQGTIGTGKTTLAKAVEQVYKVESQKAVRSVSADDIARYLSSDTLKGYYDEVRNYYSLLSIDDIGTEPAEVMTFGNVNRPITEILTVRYSHNLPVIYTTNLNSEDIETKYGERILDRMKEKAIVITFSGDSWRTQNQ